MKLWGHLFGNRQKLDLSSITLEDIRGDEIALERQEDRLEREIGQCHQRIDAVVHEVVEAGKKSKARVATRRVIQLKERIVDKDQALDMISRSLIALGRLRRLVGNAEQAVKSGVLSRLQGLPQADLTRLLCGEMARSEIATRGLDAVVEMLEAPVTHTQMAEADDEAAELMRVFEEAIEANDPTIVTQAVARDLEAEPTEAAAILAHERQTVTPVPASSWGTTS